MSYTLKFREGSTSKHFDNLQSARDLRETIGGWLLNEGTTERPLYLVTDDEHMVGGLRGAAFDMSLRDETA